MTEFSILLYFGSEARDEPFLCRSGSISLSGDQHVFEMLDLDASFACLFTLSFVKLQSSKRNQVLEINDYQLLIITVQLVGGGLCQDWKSIFKIQRFYVLVLSYTYSFSGSWTIFDFCEKYIPPMVKWGGWYLLTLQTKEIRAKKNGINVNNWLYVALSFNSRRFIDFLQSTVKNR